MMDLLEKLVQKNLAGLQFGEVTIRLQVKSGEVWRVEAERSESIFVSRVENANDQ